jgi:hypothetical protein
MPASRRPIYLTFRQILFDNSGRRLPEDVAASRFGRRVVDVAQVAEALESVRGEPRPLSRPTRVFISYRWGTNAENSWVVDLARRLEKRGCIVDLDRAQKDKPPTIGHVVARMARCHVVLMVIDQGYIDRVGASEGVRLNRGWAYVEFRLSEMMPIPLLRIGVLRSGSLVPRGMTLTTEDQMGNVIDASTPGNLEIALNTFFPKGGFGPPGDVCRKAERLLHESARAALDGDAERSWLAASEATRLAPDVPDVQQSLITAGLRLRRSDEAIRAAIRLLELEGTRFTNRRLASLAFAAGGLGGEAVKFALPIREHPAGDWTGQFVLATAWRAAGQDRAALGFFRAGMKSNTNFDKWTRDWLAKVARSGQHQPLPLAASDLPQEPPVIPVLPFDGLKPGANLQPGVPVFVELSHDLPGSLSNAEYHLTVFSQAALGPGRLHLTGLQNGDPASRLACDNCAHIIPVRRVGLHCLCERCGGELWFRREDGPSPCPYCSWTRLTLLIPAFDGVFAGCPYCRKGTFQPVARH